MYNDVHMPLQSGHVPLAWLEIHPEDAVKASVAGLLFMQFANPRGTANSLSTPYVDPLHQFRITKGELLGLESSGPYRWSKITSPLPP